MFKKNKEVKDNTVVEIVKTPKKETSFSVFQIVIFSFLFILMIWIIGFLSLELDGQKQQIRVLNNKVDQMEKGGAELLESYIDKIRDLQKIDIKDQVQQFGLDIKDNIQRVRELMFDKNDLARVEGRIGALEDYNNTYRGTNLLMLTSSTLLRDAINRGENFEVELETLGEIAENNKDVVEAIALLQPYAKTGIKTFNQLRNDFDKIADDIVFISDNPEGEGDSIRSRFVFRVKSLLQIRKIDFDENVDDTQESPDFIVAKVQNLLKNGDLVGAVSEFEKLKDVSSAGFERAKTWYDDAKLKLYVESVMSPILKLSLEKALHDVDVKKVSQKKRTFVIKEPVPAGAQKIELKRPELLNQKQEGEK